jgi:MYXO-CTERM domain-containing protein
MRAGCVVAWAVSASVVPSAVWAQGAFHRYGESWRTVSLPPVGSGSFDVKADFLADGRMIAVTGSTVYVESVRGSAVFDAVGVLDASRIGAGTDPAFLRVSPDGASVAIGAGFGKPVVVFGVAALGEPGAPAPLTSGATASYFDVAHYDARWSDASHLAITAGDFGSPSFVSVLDVMSSAGAPVNPVVVAGIGGASAGVAFDAAGRLYAGNGFDFDPGSESVTGTIRAFAPEEWMNGPVDFEAAGVHIADLLSASSLLFDLEGNLVVGGGSFPDDTGYLGVISAAALADALGGIGPVDATNPALVRRLDPLGDGSGYFGTAFDPTTGELFATSGAAWYGTVPTPSAAALLLLVAAGAGRRRRHA